MINQLNKSIVVCRVIVNCHHTENLSVAASDYVYVYVYVFSRCFYPKRLTNEDITLQLTSKLTINYIEESH